MKGGESDEAVRARLLEHRVKYTRGRSAVVRLLQTAKGPLSAAEIHRRLRSVPLSSLYRSLAVMEGVGVVSAHHGQGKAVRYELAEWLAGHHHHVVCLGCGSVDDFELDPRAEGRLHDLVELVGRQAGYDVTGHSLEVEGLCRNCR
jgi:Fe2+ or Zn2+ uptake regulation protein